VQAPVWFTSVE
jgi:hypothetical protein